jgi:hypothetical protein
MTFDYYKTAISLKERPSNLPLKWWRSDAYEQEMLELNTDELNEFVLRCRKGYSGTRPNVVYNQAPFNIPIDLKERDNILRMHYEEFGVVKERYFVFEYDGGTKVSFKNQQELLQFVQGTHPLLKSYPDMKARRVREWKAWATDDGGRGFHRHELPIIADVFKACWDTDVVDLDGVKQEIVSLLEVSGLIPPLDNRSIIRRLSSRTRDVSVLVAEESEPDRRVRQRLDELHQHESNEVDGDSVDERLTEKERSSTACIDLNDLRIEWMEHESYSYVGSLEILATETYNGNTSIDDINDKISALNGMPFSEDFFNDIRELPRHRLRRKLQNFVKLRREINSAMPSGLFNIPHKRLLLEWISDGKRYTDGERMPRKTHCISKHNGQKQLTDESAYILYKIFTGYDISMSKFNGLLNSFAAYFLGVRLEMPEFSSIPTLRNWFKRIVIIDRYRQSCDDLGTFGFTSKHGFPVLFYIITDDTKHGKHDTRHAILRTGVYEDGKHRYIVLTSSTAVTKDAEGNADLNLDVLKQYVHKKILPFLGGGTVDNAGSARAEITITLEKLMQYLKESDDPEINELSMFFGVERLVIIIPDFFHIDNIAINRASVLMSGEIERGNFSQFHARQFLQSIHDIHSRNPDMSQQIIDEILEESDETYTLRTCRERPQRWRVNGCYAKRILEAWDIKDDEGNNLIYKWAEMMHVLGGKVGGRLLHDQKNLNCDHVMRRVRINGNIR